MSGLARVGSEVRVSQDPVINKFLTHCQKNKGLFGTILIEKEEEDQNPQRGNKIHPSRVAAWSVGLLTARECIGAVGLGCLAGLAYYPDLSYHTKFAVLASIKITSAALGASLVSKLGDIDNELAQESREANKIAAADSQLALLKEAKTIDYREIQSLEKIIKIKKKILYPKQIKTATNVACVISAIAGATLLIMNSSVDSKYRHPDCYEGLAYGLILLAASGLAKLIERPYTENLLSKSQQRQTKIEVEIKKLFHQKKD